jgi:hypothetical protein
MGFSEIAASTRAHFHIHKQHYPASNGEKPRRYSTFSVQTDAISNVKTIETPRIFLSPVNNP